MKIVERIEKIIVLVLLGLMMITLVISTVELAVILYQQMMMPPIYLLNLTELMEVFGFFLMVLIGLELLETIKVYWHENRFHLEIVLIVAMIAIARKVIILDYKTFSPAFLLGMAAVILALAVSYYLVMRTYKPRQKSDADDGIERR